MAEEISSRPSNSMAQLKYLSKATLSKAPEQPQTNTCPTCQQPVRMGELVCPNCLSTISRPDVPKAGSTNRLPEDELAPTTGPLETARGQIVLEISDNGSRLALPLAESVIVGRFSLIAGDLQPDVGLNSFTAEEKGV